MPSAETRSHPTATRRHNVAAQRLQQCVKEDSKCRLEFLNGCQTWRTLGQGSLRGLAEDGGANLEPGHSGQKVSRKSKGVQEY